MSYGMSYQDFWYGDIYQTYYCLKAYELKLRQQDELLWEQGMYVYEAINDCSPILRPFSKATKPLQYSEKPYLYKKELEQKEKDKEQEVENERLKAQIWINNWVRMMKNNKNLKG